MATEPLICARAGYDKFRFEHRLLCGCGPGDTTGVNLGPIEPFQERRELRGRQSHHAILDLGPAEFAVFQALGHQAKPGLVPEQELHPAPPPLDPGDHLDPLRPHRLSDVTMIVIMVETILLHAGDDCPSNREADRWGQSFAYILATLTTTISRILLQENKATGIIDEAAMSMFWLYVNKF